MVLIFNTDHFGAMQFSDMMAEAPPGECKVAEVVIQSFI